MEKFLVSLDSKTLNNILKAIMQVDNTAVAIISYNGLILEALDSALVAAVKVYLPSHSFEYFNYKDEHEKLEFGFDVKPIYDTLKTFKGTVDIALDDKTLSFKINNFKFEFPVIETQNDFPIEKIDKSVDFDNYVTVESKALNQIINILKQRKVKNDVYNQFTISLNEKGIEILYVNTDRQEKLNFSFTEYESHLIAKNVRSAVSVRYNPEYIIKLLGRKEFEFTRIHIAPKEQILKIVYPISFTHDPAEIAYYLARQVQE